MRTSLVCMLCVCAQSLSPVLCSPMNCKPARLLCPLDFPGKNIGVCCHFLLQGIFPTQGTNLCLLHWQANSLSLSHLGSYVCYVLSHSVMSSSLWPHGLYSLPGSSVHGDSPGKNTRVNCHALLPGIFPTGIEPKSPALQADSLPSEHQGSTWILEGVAYPFYRASSQPKDRTGVSCIAGRFFMS